MKRIGTHPLETARCYLRKLEITDAAQMYENSLSDPMVSQYMSWECYLDIESVKGYLEKWQEFYNQNALYWGVFLKENDDLLGAVYLCDENSHAEVGFISYCFGSKFRGNGYATEAVKAVLKFGFFQEEYSNITTFCARSNIRSQRVLERLGFKYEAVLRKRDKTKYGYEDCLYYSLLKSEFEE